MFDMMPFESRKNASLWNPFRDFDSLERDLFRDMPMTEFKTDIKDEGDHYLMEADMPGFKKEDITIDLDSNYLTIKGQRGGKKEEKDEKGNYICRERTYGSFSRSFDVSNIDTSKVTAAYNDGVLTLTLPKQNPQVPTARRLEIK